MTQGNRHYGTFESSGEEIIILGYRKSSNDLLVAFPSALQHDEAQDLRTIVSGESAQRKDFLMDSIAGPSILESAKHRSGTDWLTFLIQQATRGSRGSNAVRRLTMKDVKFADASQKAFFGGYGPSIEPEIDKLRASTITAVPEVAPTGPSDEAVAEAVARQRAADAAAAAAPAPTAAPAAPAVDPAMAAVLQAVSGLAETNAAIMQRLETLESKPAKKAPARRKPAAKRKPATKAAAPVEAPVEPVVEPVVADDFSMTASAYGGDE